MLNKAIDLNSKIAFSEFGRAMGVLAGGMFLSMVLFPMISGVLQVVAYIGGIAGGVIFMAAGFNKLYYKSIFGESSCLYMGLPISNGSHVLSKTLVGAFWLGLFLAVILLGSVAVLAPSGIGFWGLFVSALLEKGIPSAQIAPLLVLTFWIIIISVVSLCATLLTAVITVNVIGARRFKIVVNVIVTAAVFAVVYGVRYVFFAVNSALVDAVEQAALSAGIEFIFSAALVAAQLWISRKLLDKWYNPL